MRKSSRRKKITNGVEGFEPEEIAPIIVEAPRKIYPSTVISINWDSFNTKRKIQTYEKNDIVDLYFSIQKPSKKEISALEKILSEVSDVQIYYNFLENCYRAEDEIEKANELAISFIKKFPDSLFAKISQIEIALSKNEISKIPEILDNKFDFKELYPEKATFHIQEIVCFHFAIGKYFAIVAEPDKAKLALESIESIDENHIFLKKLEKAISKNSGLKFYQKVLNKLK